MAPHPTHLHACPTFKRPTMMAHQQVKSGQARWMTMTIDLMAMPQHPAPDALCVGPTVTVRCSSVQPDWSPLVWYLSLCLSGVCGSGPHSPNRSSPCLASNQTLIAPPCPVPAHLMSVLVKPGLIQSKLASSDLAIDPSAFSWMVSVGPQSHTQFLQLRPVFFMPCLAAKLLRFPVVKSR